MCLLRPTSLQPQCYSPTATCTAASRVAYLPNWKVTTYFPPWKVTLRSRPPTTRAQRWTRRTRRASDWPRWLRLPRTGLHPALAAAVAVLISTAAYGVAAQTTAGLVVAMAGVAVFAGRGRARALHVPADRTASRSTVWPASSSSEPGPPRWSTWARSPSRRGPPSTSAGGSSRRLPWPAGSATRSSRCGGGRPTGATRPPMQAAPHRGCSSHSPCSSAWGSLRCWSAADGRARPADPRPGSPAGGHHAVRCVRSGVHDAAGCSR